MTHFVYIISCLLILSCGVYSQKCRAPPSRDGALVDRANKVFSGLSANETMEVATFLLRDPSLKLITSDIANYTSNYIYMIDDYLPKKGEVIEWLDGKSSSQPVRMAKATLYMGSTETVMELLVYPIPNPKFKTEVFLNGVPGKRINWNSRPIDIVDNVAINLALRRSFDGYDSFLKSCWNPRCPSNASIFDCVSTNPVLRNVLDSSERHIFFYFFIGQEVDPVFRLYTLPFYIIMRAQQKTGIYRLRKIYYNGVAYDTPKALADAYKSNPSLHCKPDKNGRGFYADPKHVKGNTYADSTRRPPTQIYPDGPRYKAVGRHVEWLDWSFNIHTRTLTGMQIFDVRYKNKRMAYELSMQDIVVVYTGEAPDDFYKSYFDNGYAIGQNAAPLVRGYECPYEAVYFNSTANVPGYDQAIELRDSVCVFEHRNSIPTRRHYSPLYTFSMPDSVLIVRQVLTVGNYDYIFDYEFHQNGVIDMKVSPSGYIQTSTYPNHAHDIKYGYSVDKEWDVIGLLHQHLFNFKIDLDVFGTKNRLNLLEFKYDRVSTSYAGSNPWYKMVMEERTVQDENASKFKFDFNKPMQFMMVNAEKSSKDDPSPKGIRIVLNGANKVSLPDDHVLLKGALSWAKYQLAFTKYDDNELGTASIYPQGDPHYPDINFDDFFRNNDKLVDVDLVAWASVGMHHNPVLEDTPVTTTPGKTVGVSLAPFNYFERDPSINSRDAALFWHTSHFQHANEYLHFDDLCPVTFPKVTYDELDLEE